MQNQEVSNGFSADVRLHLLVGDRRLPLAQVDPQTAFLFQPLDLPPSDAEVVMLVDGRQRRCPVYLPDGISANSRSVRLQDR